MNIGMLWFDNSTTATIDKIAKALEYYKNKYGSAANKVYVHPSMLIDSWDGVTIVASRSVMVNHFWIGTEYISVQAEVQQEIRDSEWDAMDSEEVREFLDGE